MTAVFSVDNNIHHVSPTEVNRRSSVVWRGVKVVMDFFYKVPLAVLATAVAAVVCHLLYPTLAVPLYVITTSTYFSKLVLKVAIRLKCKPMERAELYFWKMKRRFPKVQFIAFIAMLVVSCLIPILGIIAAGVLGLLNGFVIDIEYNKSRLKGQKHQLVLATFDELNVAAED